MILLLTPPHVGASSTRSVHLLFIHVCSFKFRDTIILLLFCRDQTVHCLKCIFLGKMVGSVGQDMRFISLHISVKGYIGIYWARGLSPQINKHTTLVYLNQLSLYINFFDEYKMFSLLVLFFCRIMTGIVVPPPQHSMIRKWAQLLHCCFCVA
jgi:hypothetical protein